MYSLLLIVLRVYILIQSVNYSYDLILRVNLSDHIYEKRPSALSRELSALSISMDLFNIWFRF